MSRVMLVFAGLAVLTAAMWSAGMLIGDARLGDPQLRSALLELRASRVAAAFLAGAALAVAGALMQGLFRNPLASPSILGTTAGATLGGQIAILLHAVLMGSAAARYVTPDMFHSLGAVAGAVVALVILMAIIGRRRDVIVLLLVGFILSSLFLSVGSFLVSLAQDQWELGRAVVAFSLGGVGGDGVRHVALALPLVVAGIAAAALWGRPLDLMLSGEDEAASLGVDVRAVQRWCVVWTAVLTAGAVSVGGNVGFVGLIVPHALRPIVGVEHRLLVPASALAGGGFLVMCDVVCRLPSKEIPLGVITGLIGAPIFLVLLLRARREDILG